MESAKKHDYSQAYSGKAEEQPLDGEMNTETLHLKSSQERFELKELIDLKLFQDIQRKLTEVTGLAFVTVDFKGEPITERTSFTEYCQARRAIDGYRKTCYLSDAHGGLEAAIRGEPYIYRCPAGLVDFAVPIVVKGQYLGAVLCGQVRCPEGHRFEDINEFIKSDTKWKEDPSFVEKFEKTMEVDYDTIVSTAELVYLIINQLVEKEAMHLIQEELNRKNMHLIEEKRARAELEKELKVAELKALKAQMNPHFMFNVLNSIGNLALMEGAKQTQEMSYLFSHLLRYNLENGDKAVYLKEDIENIERYLKVQKIRFGDKLNYTIEINGDIEQQKIPPFILQPFVENAVNHGIVPKESAGHIRIEVNMEREDVILKIEDDGIGMSQRQIRKIFNADQEKYEGKSLGIGIQNTRKRLINNYGSDYDVRILSRENVGTSIMIKIPRVFDERVI